MALTEDNNFLKDLCLFEGVTVEKRPENLPYSA
jgi:hypothetical protein